MFNVDREEIEEYVRALLGDLPGRAFMGSQTLGGHFLTEGFDSRDELVERMVKRGEAGSNVWCSTATFKPGSAQRTKANAWQSQVVWVDVDKCDPDEALERVESVLVPTIAVRSSDQGLQCIWLLDDALDVSDGESAARIEAINRGLVVEFDGDKAACEIGRLLRVPGTLNSKSDITPSPARLLRCAA